jgi:hypothetical protein
MAPLGCDTKGRKITVNEAEAERVRAIFRTYLKLGSLNLLMADLRKRNIVTKVRSLKTGQTVGGIPFTRGSLARLLRNRFYVGEVEFNTHRTGLVAGAKRSAPLRPRRIPRAFAACSAALVRCEIASPHARRPRPRCAG